MQCCSLFSCFFFSFYATMIMVNKGPFHPHNISFPLASIPNCKIAWWLEKQNKLITQTRDVTETERELSQRVNQKYTTGKCWITSRLKGGKRRTIDRNRPVWPNYCRVACTFSADSLTCSLRVRQPNYSTKPLTHSLTAALDQLRVVASSTSNDPGPKFDGFWG